MLQVKRIFKEYKTGNLVQKVLNGVSLNLRDNEFVAILGPSGSGKTTLLNIIGGLDRYDSGDLIINGISTKKYKDRDWDSYRNHTIGFVFQSYNLIPHQTILSNVELALTISGISKSERKKRAAKALEEVGLGDQLHKRPSQMSGGQMQRVAIARALVNNPDILLADEPTGALDSDTSIQVMELLQEVAKDRLVVMVTHNPELADAYATRIVKLRDGQIQSDSDPYEIDEASLEEPEHKNMGKASMSFLTALSLSFNNLRTKKARTLLTSFAGSIGIIGIALILSLSNGVNQYIQSVEEDTLSEYPLEIQSTGINLSSMISGETGGEDGSDSGDVKVRQVISGMFSTMDSNDLESLKNYLDSGESGIGQYANAVEYAYNVTPRIYRVEDDGVRQVNPDTSFEALGLGASSGSNSLMSMAMSTNVFYEMPENTQLFEGQYDIKAGRWPQNYDECVLVLTPDGSITDFMLYTLGLRDSVELDDMIQQFIDEEDIDTPTDTRSYSYDEILGITFKLVNNADLYQYDSEYGVWTDKSEDEEYVEELVKNGEDLTIVGVVQPSEDASASLLSSGIGYPASLVEHVAQQAENSEIVKAQLQDPQTNVFTGEAFGSDEGQGSFDMESLFTVDTEAFQNAFHFDPDGLMDSFAGSMNLDAENVDLSGMIDLSGISLDLPDSSQIDLGSLIDSLDLTVSAEGLQQMASDLMNGYQQYAASHPEADLTRLNDAFAAYLSTPEAQEILARHISEIIQSGGGVNISSGQLQTLVSDVMSGFQEYALANDYTDPSRFSEYLAMYLATPQAQQILANWASQLLPDVGDITISSDQLQALADELAAGYQSYAVANGYPDPSKIGEYLADYLNTSEAGQIMSDSLAAIVNVDDLEQQIGASIENYMRQTMSAYSQALGQTLESQMTSAMQQIMDQISSSLQSGMQQAASQLGDTMGSALSIDAAAFSDVVQVNMDSDELTELLMSLSSTRNATYESNLQTLGYVDFAVPTTISIYPKDFESKEYILDILDGYNARMEAEGKEDQVIAYTDMVGTLMSSVTDIIDVISYVLVAFVAISLVVSSIMIGVITYISVLERKKEIGILRAIGASKRNVSQVFNAETFIIGLCAGLIGIGLTLLLLIPGNALIHHIAGQDNINAVLPVVPAIVLIILSVLLTLIGGLIPSRKAAKSDPVTALRVD